MFCLDVLFRLTIFSDDPRLFYDRAVYFQGGVLTLLSNLTVLTIESGRSCYVTQIAKVAVEIRKSRPSFFDLISTNNNRVRFREREP